MIFVFNDPFSRARKLADPQVLAGHDLDAYGASWGRRLQQLPGAFQRGEGEADVSYRLRLVELIKSRVEG